MNIIVCGGRDYDDYEKLISVLDSVHAKVCITLLIEGGALGADAHAGTWANHNGIARATIHANWAYYGKKAGPIRNKTMLTLNPGGLIAFPGGIGTEGMIKLAVAAGVKVMRVQK
jgi:hypothetical protein